MHHYFHISEIFRRCCIILMLCLGICCWMQEAKGQFAGGSGTSADPYLIETAAQLAKLAELVNACNGIHHDKYYKLVDDIDLSEYGVKWNNGQGWIPIGGDCPFSGVFDGNNKIITGLYINYTIDLNVGFFGHIKDSAKIQNLGIEGANIQGWTCCFTGGIAGLVANSNITGCYVTGRLNGNAPFIGGVVGGIADGSTVSNSHFNGVVSSDRDEYSSGGIGSVVGSIYWNSIVINCYSIGIVSNNNNNHCAIGGIAGEVTYNSTVSNCYSTSMVNNIASSGTGGVVGLLYNESSVDNCFSTGSVNSFSIYGNATGGVVGGISKNSSVTNCYSTGTVTGSSTNYLFEWAVGGVLGMCENDGNSVTNCAALNPSVKGDLTVGRLIGNGSGTFSGSIAFCGMTNDGGASFVGENTTSGRGGKSISGADLQTADGFPVGFTSAPWTYVPGMLPGLFGEAVEIPEHLHPSNFPVFDAVPSRSVDLDNVGSITVYPADFVTNVFDNDDLAFLFVIDKTDYPSLMFTCYDIGSRTVSIVATKGECIRSLPKDVTITINDPTPLPVFDVIFDQDIPLDISNIITVYPIDFVENVSNNDDVTFWFDVNGSDQASLTFTCDNISSHIVSIFAIAGKCYRSQPQDVTITISDPSPPIARCKPVTLYMDSYGKATLTSIMIDNESTDNCAIVSRQIKRTMDTDDYYNNSLDFDYNDLGASNVNVISVTLRVKDVSGNVATCTSTVRLEQVNPPELGDIPGIFTPNGDGFNDTWDISGIDQFPEATIRIYSRTKKLMVELKGAQMPWDGRDRNENLLESGYYLYQIELQKGMKIIAGYITILR